MPESLVSEKKQTDEAMTGPKPLSKPGTDERRSRRCTIRTYDWPTLRSLHAEVFHAVPRGQTVNRLLMFVGMTVGGYVGWCAGDYIGFGLMGTFLVSSLGSLAVIYVAWRVLTEYPS